MDLSADDEWCLFEASEMEERHRVVLDILARMPVHYKQVLLLKYVEEMSVVEMSQVMHRSAKSVEGLLSRARRELRKGLNAWNEGWNQINATNIVKAPREVGKK